MNLLCLTIISSIICLFNYCVAEDNNRTLILNPTLRLSTRRKRTLLLPNYGSIKFTVGLTKALIGNNPKGLSLSYEICSYFAGPTVIGDFFSELKQKKHPQEHRITKANTTNYLKPSPAMIQEKYRNISGTHFSNLGEDVYKKTRMIINLSDTSKYTPRSIKSSNPRDSLKAIFDYLWRSVGRCNILKILCKSEEISLPPEYSMIQDIFRIISMAFRKDQTLSGENYDICEDVDENCN